MINKEPRQFPDMSDNGMGYPNTSKWDLAEALERRLEEETNEEHQEEDFNFTENEI
jgi:hypothetical protein